MSDSLRSLMTPKGGGTKSIAGSLRRFTACRRGTSSVEFVLVLGPMILFLFGIIGFGLITYAHNNMVNAAREATRRLSVAEDVVVAANFGTTVQAPVACFSGAYDGVVATANDAGMTAAEKLACDYLANWGITFWVTAKECVAGSDREVSVLITTTASDAFMVDLWGFFTGDLEAEVIMRREAVC